MVDNKPKMLTLPNELLVSLVDHLDCASRAALAQTCHTLNLLTTPYLYESANIKRGKSDEFVRTVAEKYADLVRHVTVEARGWGIDISPCRVVPCLEKLENMQSLTLIGDYWMWDVEGEENWDTLEEQLWEYLERISLKQPLASRISTSLRSLTLDRTQRNGQAAFINYSHIFIIPQLHNLTLRGFMLQEEDGKIDPRYERQTELLSLCIENGWVNFPVLKRVLRAPKALRQLIIGQEGCFGVHERDDAEAKKATVAEFVEVLLPHRDTLEKIQVIVNLNYDNWGSAPEINALSFQEYATQFPVLKHWIGCDTCTLTSWLGSDEDDENDE